MKRSIILYGILCLMVLALVVVVCIVPQPVLDDNEIYFMLYLVVMSGLWFQAYIDASKGN